jgi:hypothetical protein
MNNLSYKSNILITHSNVRLNQLPLKFNINILCNKQSKHNQHIGCHIFQVHILHIFFIKVTIYIDILIQITKSQYNIHQCFNWVNK